MDHVRLRPRSQRVGIDRGTRRAVPGIGPDGVDVGAVGHGGDVVTDELRRELVEGGDIGVRGLRADLEWRAPRRPPVRGLRPVRVVEDDPGAGWRPHREVVKGVKNQVNLAGGIDRHRLEDLAPPGHVSGHHRRPPGQPVVR